jgi:hypothetical protein
MRLRRRRSLRQPEDEDERMKTTRVCDECGARATTMKVEAEGWIPPFWRDEKGRPTLVGWICRGCLPRVLEKARTDPVLRALNETDAELQEHLDQGGSLQ